MSERAYTIELSPDAMTFAEAQYIVRAGGFDPFNPTTSQAVANTIVTLAERVIKANDLYRQGLSSGLTDNQFDALEKTLMCYCSDWESQL